jgi:hypothetical protein
VVACDSIIEVRDVLVPALQKAGIKALAHTGESSDLEKLEIDNNNTTWAQYDVVLYTPVITYGTSHDPAVPDIDCIFGFFTGNSITAVTANQMLQRVRAIKSKTVHIFCPPDDGQPVNFSPASLFEARCQQKELLLTQMRCCKAGKEGFLGRESTTVIQYQAGVEYEVELSKRRFTSVLACALMESGGQCVRPAGEEEDPEEREIEVDPVAVDADAILAAQDVAPTEYTRLLARGDKTTAEHYSVFKHMIAKVAGYRSCDLTKDVIEAFYGDRCKTLDRYRAFNRFCTVDLEALRQAFEAEATTTMPQHREHYYRTQLFIRRAAQLLGIQFGVSIEYSRDEIVPQRELQELQALQKQAVTADSNLLATTVRDAKKIQRKRHWVNLWVKAVTESLPFALKLEKTRPRKNGAQVPHFKHTWENMPELRELFKRRCSLGLADPAAAQPFLQAASTQPILPWAAGLQKGPFLRM